MRITKRFKNKLEQAKRDGYKRVEVTIGGHMATVYCAYWPIEYLLSLPIGFSVDSGSKRLRSGVSKRTHSTNTDIEYLQVFRRYED